MNMNYIKHIVALLLFYSINWVNIQAQGLNIGSSSYVKVSGSPLILINNGNFENNGSYTKATEKIIMNGTVAAFFKGNTFVTSVNNIDVLNTGGITTVLKTLYSANMFINSDSKLTVSTGSYVHVSTNLSNNAGVSGLILKANSTDPNASLSFMNALELPVNATVEMYSKASWNLQSTSLSKYKWQFIGIPVQNFNVTPTFDGGYVRKYNEAGIGAGLLATNRWIQLTNNTLMTNINAYEIVQSAPKMFTFTGTLYNQNFSKTLTYTPGADYPGQHQIGNPYTAAIDIRQIQFGANTQAIVYIYNTGTFNSWSSVRGQTLADSTIYTPGQYTAVPYELAGTSSLPRQISPMQVFMIKTSGTTAGSMSINYSSVIQRNFSIQRAKKTSLSWLKLSLVGATLDNDVAWIYSQDGTTRGYDNGWDGPKMAGDAGTARIQSVEADGTYQINTVPDIHETTLSARAGSTDTSYKLRITSEGIKDKYNVVYLLDLQTNQVVDITESGVEYAFTMTNTSSVPRFKILTYLDNTTGTFNESSELSAYYTNAKIIINNKALRSCELKVYNIQGNEVLSKKLENLPLSTVSLDLTSGVYVYKLISEDVEPISAKIIIE